MTVLNLRIEDRKIETYVKTHNSEEINKDIIKFLAEKIIKEQQKKINTKKSKWAKLAERMHEKSPLDRVSEEANKLFKQFREESSF